MLDWKSDCHTTHKRLAVMVTKREIDTNSRAEIQGTDELILETGISIFPCVFATSMAKSTKTRAARIESTHNQPCTNMGVHKLHNNISLWYVTGKIVKIQTWTDSYHTLKIYWSRGVPYHENVHMSASGTGHNEVPCSHPFYSTRYIQNTKCRNTVQWWCCATTCIPTSA